MSDGIEVPQLSDLDQLLVEVGVGTDPGVVTVTAVADDEARLRVTWDERARSVTVQWEDGSGERLRIYRETVTRVMVRATRVGTEFEVLSAFGDLQGRMFARAEASVTISDEMMRT